MRTSLWIGIFLMGLSFYSIGPVLCDKLFENTCYKTYGTEHFYSVLPFFLVMFGLGMFVFLKSINKLRRPKNKILIAGIIIATSLISGAVFYVGQPFSVAIDQLKQEYDAREPITFGIRVVGFGNVCSEPHVVIFRTDTPWPQDGSNIIWSNNYQTGCIGNSQYRFFNNYWKIEDISDVPIIVNESGKFKLSVSHGNKSDEKEFVVVGA